MEAIEYGLSSLIFKSLKEGHGRLFIRMFVYLRPVYTGDFCGDLSGDFCGDFFLWRFQIARVN